MIEIIDTQKRLEDIKAAWDALADESQSPLLSHAWIASSTKAFARIAMPAVFVLWDRDQIRAAAPLGLFRDGLTDRLHFIGYLLREPNSLLYRDEPALRDLVTHIFSHARPFSMARLASSGVEERVLQAACPRGTLMLRAQTGVTHAALLPPSIEAMERAMSSNARSSFRRKLKRARTLGEVTFTVDRPCPGRVSEFIDELIRIEASGWKGRLGTAIAFDPALKTFFHEFGARASAAGNLRVYRMAINGATVATRLGAVAGAALFELKIAFNEEFKDVSPGLLLTQETLKFAIDEGLNRHEFLGMAEDWQKHWPLERKEQASFRSYPIGTAGAFAIGHDVYGKLRDRLMPKGSMLAFGTQTGTDR
jgi:CelD/BcsL family acetyltransferase involved in cellulose biosynthesis